MKEVVLGTIGSGPIVHYILNGVKRTKGVRLGAVYSRTAETGNRLAEEYGCSTVYTDLDEMLQNEEINTVYVASPNLLHFEQAEKALLAGKHVWCEKPFVTTVKEAERLISLAEEKGLMLVETAPTTFLPNYRILCEKLPLVGRVRLVMGSYSQYSSRYDNLKNGQLTNIFNPAMAGGCLMDINFYNVLLCCALFGKPDTAAYHPNLYPEIGCDTSGIAVLRYGDFLAECSGAKDTWGDNFFQIQGEDGYIAIDGGASGFCEIKVVTREGSAVHSHQPEPDRWYYEVQELTRLYLAEDMEKINARHKIILDTVTTMCELRASAGLVYPHD